MTTDLHTTGGGQRLAALILPLLLFLTQLTQAEPQQAVPKLTYGGPFTLVDHHGNTVTDKDFRGEFLLIYFGYTHCPDVCPASLGTLAGTLRRLQKQGIEVRPLFISVDVKRDTPEVLADYVKAFSPRMVGLTGSPKQIGRVTRAYHAHYFAGEVEGKYRVSHTGSMYLVGPDGRFLKSFKNGITVTDLAQGVATQIHRFNQQAKREE